MSRLRGQAGLSLIELLVVLSLLSVVIGATTSGFSAFMTNQRVGEVTNDAQDTARNSMTALARELRNLAGPEDYQPDGLLRAQANDLILQTVDNAAKPAGSTNERNVKRVRYCLEQPGAGAGRLVAMEQKWTTAAPPALPAATQCPGTGWANSRPVARDVVNGQESKAVFSYTPAGAPTLENIRAIRSELLVDTDLADSRPRTQLSSSVFLRNQNRAPTAALVATYTGNARQVVLNGSASEDPEGHSLKSYTWYRVGSSTPIGTGIVLYWTAPSAGAYNFKLTVEDHAGLKADASTSEAVNVP